MDKPSGKELYERERKVKREENWLRDRELKVQAREDAFIDGVPVLLQRGVIALERIADALHTPQENNND